jgi:colanic acid biosynthesis glycosyl transferase WcaI
MCRAHPLRQKVNPHQPPRCHPRVRQRAKPPAGTAPGVQHQPLSSHRPLDTHRPPGTHQPLDIHQPPSTHGPLSTHRPLSTDRTVTAQLRPGHLQQRAQDFLAHRPVPQIIRAPGPLLAAIPTILFIGTRDPLPLLPNIHLRRPPNPRPLRVLLLTHYYPPEVGAAPARIAALARGLCDRGMEVTVHTGFPHYPSGTITSPYRNRLVQVRREGGVRVVRSLVYPTPNRGFARRLVNHTVFAAGALATCAASGPVDVVVAETPPLFTAFAGVIYAKVKRARLALNVSDLWPESAIELGAIGAGSAATAAHALARLCYRSAALITAPTRGIVESLDVRPEARGKVIQVPPAVDLERFATLPAPSPRADAPLRVLYAGTLGMAQGLGTLIEAAALAGPRVVEVRIAGDGPDAEPLRRQVSARALDHVHLLGAVAAERVPSLYAAADAGVVPLRDLPLFSGALPTKLFEVLAAGRPAIVAAHGEAAELVRESGAGLTVAPEDAQALADAFRLLQADPLKTVAMGERGRLCAHRFDRSAAVGQWERLLREKA